MSAECSMRGGHFCSFWCSYWWGFVFFGGGLRQNRSRPAMTQLKPSTSGSILLLSIQNNVEVLLLRYGRGNIVAVDEPFSDGEIGGWCFVDCELWHVQRVEYLGRCRFCFRSNSSETGMHSSCLFSCFWVFLV